MVDHNLTISFLVVSDLFDRYTIVVNTSLKTTSVYCEQCDEWVNRWDGDQLSRYTANDLKRLIIDEHREQVLGKFVGIAEEPNPLSIDTD